MTTISSSEDSTDTVFAKRASIEQVEEGKRTGAEV